MPYTNVPDELQDKMESCVQKLVEGGREKESAIAICYASVVEGKSDEISAAIECGFVLPEWEVKVGARNNASDQQRIQSIHDMAVENGAQCAPKRGILKDNEAMLETDPAAFGGSVKALDDSGRVGGYLVRYSSAADPDLTGDYFTQDTDFGEPGRLPVLYHHGFDATVGKRRLGMADVKADDVGLWAEAQLALRDKYERRIFDLVKAGKLGWSSGAAGHAVSRTEGKAAAEITQWYIAEASLTPTPAEYRNGVMPIKSLITSDAGCPDQGEQIAINEQSREGDTTMSEIDIKALASEVAAEAVRAVRAYAETLKPDVKAGFAQGVQITQAEEDKPFVTAGEFFKAVKTAATAPHVTDPRLMSLKATGANETIPSQGGFLVPPQYAAGILERMYGIGNILSRVPMDTITGNVMNYNAVDETSRVAGSRWGGLLGYWLAEGGTKTSTKPKFRQIELKLKKVAALCYATDELLEDASALAGWLNRTVPEELRFMVEDSVVNGDGVGKPLGITASPAFITPARYAGSQINTVDVVTMWSRRWAGANDYVWLINQDITPYLYQMSVGNFPVYLPAGGLADAPFARLMGKPVIETEYNQTLGTAGDIILFSPSAYQMIGKGGIQAAQSIHVAFTTDETAFRFVFRTDGAPTWDSALTPFKGSATQSPYVGLSASTS